MENIELAKKEIGKHQYVQLDPEVVQVLESADKSKNEAGKCTWHAWQEGKKYAGLDDCVYGHIDDFAGMDDDIERFTRAGWVNANGDIVIPAGAVFQVRKLHTPNGIVLYYPDLDMELDNSLNDDDETLYSIVESKSEGSEDDALMADVVFQQKLEALVYESDNLFYASIPVPNGSKVQAVGATKYELKSAMEIEMSKAGYVVTGIFGPLGAWQDPTIKNFTCDVIIKQKVEALIYKSDNVYYASVPTPDGSKVQAEGVTSSELKHSIEIEMSKAGYIVNGIFGFNESKNEESEADALTKATKRLRRAVADYIIAPDRNKLNAELNAINSDILADTYFSVISLPGNGELVVELIEDDAEEAEFRVTIEP